ncbi:hypothetical protein [Metabacillus halosaccharovorans]|uniref:hypothetical protein n=1 Tax=Metabacillus halosaccharovorans TaxID=930124 RepID=UPI0009954B90|nr:hypothetical protein [Metabacillus halosaccharovorans]
MNKYKKWYLKFLTYIIASFLIILSINLLVDPYNVYKTPTIKGFNDNKIETKEYLMKAREIAIYKPDTIFLGSSRTRVGLDPDYYKKITSDSAYNSGLSSSNIYIQLKYLEYALQNNKSLKRVILGIDFEAFNSDINISPYYKEDRLNSPRIIKNDLIDTLFTKQAFEDSIKVLIDNSLNKSYFIQDKYLDNGSHNEDILFTISQKSFLLGKNRFYENLKEQIDIKSISSEYQLSKVKLNNLRNIVEFCKKNNIELLIFIQPVHSITLEGYVNVGSGSEDKYEQWKKEVVNITPIWDFSGFNRITTTSTDNFNYYIDASHYRKNVGNFILDRLLGNPSDKDIPGDFGVYLTKENIVENILENRQNKEEWEGDNPQIVNKVRSLFIYD